MITLTPSSTLANTYSLNWNAQQSHIFDGLRSLVGQDDILLTDVTLACDGEYIQAHKLVLSLCSSFFKDLFMKNKADKSNTIIILGNVSALNLRYLLQFMYQGKVDIPSKDVDSFLQAGNLLKIEGLIGNVADNGQMPVNSNVSHHQTQHQQAAHRSDIPTIPQRSVRAHPTSSGSATPPNKASVPGSTAGCESPTPIKKPRLTGDPGSSGMSSIPAGCDSNSTPVIVGEPVTIKVPSNQAQPPSSGVMDPLDEEQYEHDDIEEGDGEEGIDFNHFKTEPIQVYSNYEESNQSEMMHNESVGEDSYGGSIDDSYGLAGPVPPSALQMSASLPTVSVPGPSTSTHPANRPRGSVPVILDGQFFQIQITDETGRVKAKCMICSKMNSKEVLISGRFNPTSNFNTHLKRRHPEEHKTYEEFLISLGRSKKPLIIVPPAGSASGWVEAVAVDRHKKHN